MKERLSIYFKESCECVYNCVWENVRGARTAVGETIYIDMKELIYSGWDCRPVGSSRCFHGDIVGELPVHHEESLERYKTLDIKQFD